MFCVTVLVTLLLVGGGLARNDPLTTLTAYEEKQRTGAQLDSSDYSLVPFRLAHAPQVFILAPNVDETISVEVVVHWITPEGELKFPLFDLAQKVRLTLQEETYGATAQKPTLTKEFLTQSGFRVKLQGGRKYRVRLESAGKQVKLVEIALTSRQHALPPLQTTKNHTNQLRLLEQMRANLAQAQQRWTQRSMHEDVEEEAESVWAWMSGIEMVSLLTFVGLQIFLFERFSLPSSVI